MFAPVHYNDIMGAIASQITSLTTVYSTVYSGVDQRKHQSSASLAFVRGINRGPANSPHKWPVTRKMFPFDDVIVGKSHDCPVHVYRSASAISLKNTGDPLTEAYVTIQWYLKLHTKISVTKMHILQCMASKFIMTFRMCPLKFHTKCEHIHLKICILRGVTSLANYDILIMAS